MFMCKIISAEVNRVAAEPKHRFKVRIYSKCKRLDIISMSVTSHLTHALNSR